jgi:hypothetical protein
MPFELVFAELAERHFGALAAEAAQRNQDLADRGQFASLPSVQRMLAEIEAPDLVERAPEAAAEYLSLLYAAYHYWSGGRPLIEIDRATLEERLNVGLSVRRPTIRQACYVQFPERLVWAQIEPNAPHEPLDGMFIVAGPQGREFTVVAILGLRAERGGFSQITAVATPEEFAAAAAEARHPPFAPVLDGGERMGFKSVTSAAELLLLASLATAETGR